MKALIVDDNQINRHVLRELLNKYGESEMAASGKKAIELFSKALDDVPFDLICLDIGMPEMDGHETLQTIRALEQEQHIPEAKQVKVLMISAFSDRENVLRAYEFCQGYIKKPIIRSVFFEKLAILGFFKQKKSSVAQERKEQRLTSPEEETRVGETEEAELKQLPEIIVKNNGLSVLYQEKDGAIDGILEKPLEDMDEWQNLRSGTRFARITPENFTFQLGNGLKLRERKNILLADKSGRLEWLDGTLQIVEKMEIDGPLANRNVHFVGKVEVNGEVKDGVLLVGEKEIVVQGNIGVCHLESQGEVTFSRSYGGMRGLIRSKQNIKCDCVYESIVEANSKLFIKTECVNSDLKAGDFIKCNGTITGGTMLALNLIDVKRLGSPKDVSTHCYLGKDFRLTSRREELLMAVDDLDKQILQKTQMLGPYADDLGKAMILPEIKKNRIYAYAEELNTLQQKKKDAVDEIHKIETNVFLNMQATLVVHHKLYKGVSLQIGDVKELFAENIDGPVRISADHKNNQFLIEKLQS